LVFVGADEEISKIGGRVRHKIHHIEGQFAI
jgi:hypothetical protein